MRSPTGRSSASTPSASRSHGRAWRPTRAATRPPPASSRPIRTTRGYHWGVIDAAVDRLAAAGIEPILMLDGPPPLWASGNPSVGNPRYRPSAPAFGAFAAAAAQRYGARVDHYILWNEPNLPLWIQPQADCGTKRCSPVSPTSIARWSSPRYQAIHAVDPAATVLIGALAPAGGDLKSRNANMRPLKFLRALGCLDAKLRAGHHGRLPRRSSPRSPTGFAYHPHSTRHAPTSPTRTPTTPTSGASTRSSACSTACSAWGRLRGSVDAAEHLARRVRLPDQPARQAARRLARRARTAICSRPRTSPGATRASSCSRSTCGRTSRSRRRQATPAGSRACTTPTASPKPALAHFDSPIWVDFRANVAVGPGPPRRRPHRSRSSSASRAARRPGSRSPTVTTGDDGALVSCHHAGRPRVLPRDRGRRHHERAMVAAPPGRPPTTSGRRRAGDRARSSSAGRSATRRAQRSRRRSRASRSSTGRRPTTSARAASVNPIFAQLSGRWPPAGNGAPTIRFGGNSTDETWWNPAAAPRPAGDRHRHHARLARAVLRPMGRAATRTPIILGLNLGARRRGQRRRLRAGGGRRRCRPAAVAHLRDRQRARSLHAAASVPRSARGASSAGCRAPDALRVPAATAASSARSPPPSPPRRRASRCPRAASRRRRGRTTRTTCLDGARAAGASARTPTRCPPATPPRARRSAVSYARAAAAGAPSPPLVSRAWPSSPRSRRPRRDLRVSETNSATAAACTRREQHVRLRAVGHRHALRPGRGRRRATSTSTRGPERSTPRSTSCVRRGHRRAGPPALLRDAALRPRDAARRAATAGGAERAQRAS